MLLAKCYSYYFSITSNRVSCFILKFNMLIDKVNAESFGLRKPRIFHKYFENGKRSMILQDVLNWNLCNIFSMTLQSISAVVFYKQVTTILKIIITNKRNNAVQKKLLQ